MSDYVAWCRYVNTPNGGTCIQLCDSDTEGAFRVYRHSDSPQGVDISGCGCRIGDHEPDERGQCIYCGAMQPETCDPVSIP